ncbi:MAG: HlyD family type I secretion periplasmic adaptor subunit [Desulforhopalus sp.]
MKKQPHQIGNQVPLSRLIPNRHTADNISFMSEVDAATRRTGSKFAYLLSLVSFLLFIAAIFWAHNAVVDEVTRGIGQVIPSKRVQVIQNLEGGILDAILVSENQIVNENDILLRIHNTLSSSQYRDAISQSYEHRAAIIRLNAEIKGTELFFNDDTDLPEQLMDVQKDIYNARKNQLQSELNILQTQVLQKQQEITEMSGRQKQLRKSLNNTQKQLGIAKPLLTQELFPEIDYLKIEGELINLQGEISAIKLRKPRVQQAIIEIEQKILQREAVFHTAALDELSNRTVELNSLQKAIEAGRDRVTRTDVRSPVRGTVKQININTIGGVIRPGEPILDIVPLDDTLLIEARIRPADIAFLHPGQQAMIKITAYDFSIYGGMAGEVEQISADTIQGEKGESFFKVKLRTKSNTLSYRGDELPIIPGMMASVDIMTGEKTVLDYLLKPILKAKQNALRER